MPRFIIKIFAPWIYATLPPPESEDLKRFKSLVVRASELPLQNGHRHAAVINSLIFDARKSLQR